MTEQTVGRNEPCPCGSGKKYKRCCGVDAAPKLSTPKSGPVTAGTLAAEAGIDPSQMDQAQLGQMSQAFQRLPRGQMQKLQSLMQRAMSGRDISQEAEEFQKTLPFELQQMLQASFMNAPGGSTPPASAHEMSPNMSEEEAKKIVEAAAAEGRISKDEAQDLLKEKVPAEKGKFWRGLTGKK